MSTQHYLIYARLDLPYNIMNITMILQQGLSLGFVYGHMKIKKGPMSDFRADLFSLTVEQIIMNIQCASNHNGAYSIRIHTKKYIKPIFAYLMLAKRDNQVGVMLGDMGHGTLQDYPDKQDHIDLHHYVHVFLDLVGNYKIINMNIIDND